jgi:hypothetical protein
MSTRNKKQTQVHPGHGDKSRGKQEEKKSTKNNNTETPHVHIVTF